MIQLLFSTLTISQANRLKLKTISCTGKKLKKMAIQRFNTSTKPNGESNLPTNNQNIIDMKFFIEYNLDEKIPANIQEVFSKVKEISNISLDIGYYSDEYFTAWVHFGLESSKEERSNAISLLQSLGKEAYRFSKFTFDGLYLELYWKAKKRS